MGKGKNGKKKKGKSDKDADKKKAKASLTVTKVIAPEEDAPTIKTPLGSFDLEDPVLPQWIEDRAFKSGGYPYDEPIKRKLYEEELTRLQVELVKLQRHVADTGMRLVLVFEGRDAAGKGGAIFVIHQYLNPRAVRAVALPKPTETERGQWYFQRYASHLPTAGEIVLFDRSWYNRAGVEPVMGFCTPAQHTAFLAQAPGFERMLVNDGIHLFKFWLNIGREMQIKRFHERRHNALKVWKLSSIDYAALTRWDAYRKARDQMFEATDKPETPWTIVRANDQKRARLNVVRHLLASLSYPGKDKGVVREPDASILGSGQKLLGSD
jgi:polyphosphate kinase 2